MSLEEGGNRERGADDALELSRFQLKTLYELNQELSTLRNVRAVLESSLLYMVGMLGLRSGLVALYKYEETYPYESAHFNVDEDTRSSWFRELEPHLESSYIREICVAQDSGDHPLAQLLKAHDLCIWLPLELDEESWGGIALGLRLSEADFTEDDQELLTTISINIQNVLSNVSMIEALNQAVVKEKRIRNVFQRYAPPSVINEVLNPSNEELLLGESQEVQRMFEQMIHRLTEQHTLEKDLELARDVQRYLLPNEAPPVAGAQIVARSIPARGVCGDLYDFIPLNPHELGISLADISGKGMPAAMIASMLQSATRMCVGSYYPIPAILSILNRFLFRHTESGRYATMFYGQIDARERMFTYSNGGHPPPILYSNGELQLLEVGGPLVGIFDDSSYDQETIRLQSGDVLVIYSDGVTHAGTMPESLNRDDAFGQERLEAAILANANLPANAILDAIFEEVTRYVGNNKQFDDITLIVVKAE